MLTMCTENFSYTPAVIADGIFANVGNYSVVVDQGYFTIAVRVLLKVFDNNQPSSLFYVHDTEISH